MKPAPRYFHVATEGQILTLANDLQFARMELSTLRCRDRTDQDTRDRIARCIDHAMTVIREFHTVENKSQGQKRPPRS